MMSSSIPADDILESVEILTKCLFCRLPIADAVWLPCVHVVCSRCLDRSNSSNSSNSSRTDSGSVSCPFCHRTYPASELRTDYFVRDLADGHRTTGVSFCGFCENEADEEARSETRTPATKRCADCRRDLCDDCAKGHRKHCRDHVMFDLDDVNVRRRSVSTSMPRCRHHPEEKLKKFCVDCHEVLCLACYAERHKAHTGKDITSASNDLQPLLKDESRRIDVSISGLSTALSELEKQRKSYENDVTEAQDKIRKKGEELKSIVDVHVDNLLQELDSITGSTFEEIRKSTKILHSLIADLNYVRRYSLVLAQTGSPSHVVSSYHRLCAKTAEAEVEAKRAEVNGSVCRRPEVVFAKPDAVERISGDTKEVVGRLSLSQTTTEEKEVGKAESGVELRATLSTDGRWVTGVTHLDRRIYVTCAWSNAISVYDADHPFARHPSILVKDMRCPNDVASCTDNRCLYVVDSDKSCVWRVSPPSLSPDQSDPWLARTGQPWTISVGGCGRVLLAAEGRPPHLNVYDPGAEILQRVRLPSAIFSIQHAIELPTGHFIVGYGRDCSTSISASTSSSSSTSASTSSSTGVICEVSKNGDVIRSLESSASLKWPRHLAFDGRDRIFVAELSNHCVLELNERFHLERVLLSWERDQVDAPSRLCHVPGTSCLLLLAEATCVKVYGVDCEGPRARISPPVVSKRQSIFKRFPKL